MDTFLRHLLAGWCLVATSFSAATDTRIIKEVLDAHNILRAMHGAPALKLNRTISAVSQDWANHLASGDKFEHRPDDTFGENLFFGYNIGLHKIGVAVVQNWYNEIKDYTPVDELFEETNNSKMTGHFTQLVWKNSKELGIGYSKVGGKHYAVCNYYPRGNVIGEFINNVSPAKEKKKVKKISNIFFMNKNH